MLRIALSALGLVVAAYGLVALALSWPGGPQALAFGLLLGVGVLIERTRYKRLERAAPDPRFQPTSERFIDPETRAAVTVYFDPATGERKYVRD